MKIIKKEKIEIFQLNGIVEDNIETEEDEQLQKAIEILK